MKQPIAVCLADTHLNESTIEVNFSVFIQAFDLCDKLGIKTIFHLGDILTSRKGQTQIVLNALAEILNIAKERGIEIIAIAGNHDKTDNTISTSFLDPFNSHPAFTCFGMPRHIDVDSLRIHFVSYYDESLTYKTYFDLLNISTSRRNVLLTHIGVNEIKNNDGSKVENGVTQSIFDPFDLVLIGHYHNRQIIGNRKHIVYTGSTHQANFGEDLYKGATILYDDASYEFFNFSFPQYITVDISAEELDRTVLTEVRAVKDEGNKYRFKITGEIHDSKLPIIAELQSLVKVEAIKKEFVPSDIAQNNSIQLTNNDIIETFKEWGKEKKDIDDFEFGLKILNKNL